MPESNKRILIVCWSFPPNPGIGGRRWGKFAKYLQREGYEVFVIKSQNTIQGKSQWTNDIDYNKLKVFELRQNRFARWLNPGNTIIDKLKYRIAFYWLRLSTKGTVFDSALGSEKNFISLMESVITNYNIDKVIVTGAPFNLLYYASTVLKKYPAITSIADYRDPWMDAENYGMKSLSPKRKKYEEEKQNRVLENFTYVTAPNIFLLNQIKQTYTGKAAEMAEFIELAHAYDEDNYTFEKENNTITEKEDNTIKIIYGGAMYMGIDSYVEKLSNAISKYNTSAKNNKIKAVFHTESYQSYQDKFSELVFLPPVKTDFIQVIKQADLLLVMCGEHNKNYKTTKFYEYFPLKKPLLYIGPPGYVSETIVNEKSGFVLDTEDSLLKIINSFQNYMPNPDIEKHNFHRRTQEVINLLTSITK